MLFTGDEAQFVPKGLYIYQLVIGTGSATFQTSQEGLAFTPLPDGAFTASDTKEIKIVDSEFKAGLTGDAQLSLLRYSTVYE